MDNELYEELEKIIKDAADRMKNLESNQIIKILKSGCLAGVDHRLTDYSIRFNDIYEQLKKGC